ncbi:MAG: reverse transcriptase-like protein, partial [Candidatus Eremiobacteraeota bacterium]|nr:reverse transcriptase-like protein [Candidatus Eremiobacteraeota bacterium]
GLVAAKELGVARLAGRLDSELVVRQLGGQYRVKHDNLRPLYARAKALLSEFDDVDVRHVPRSENKLADALVNRILDER